MISLAQVERYPACPSRYCRRGRTAQNVRTAVERSNLDISTYLLWINLK